MRPIQPLTRRILRQHLDLLAGQRVCVLNDQADDGIVPATGRRVERRTVEDWMGLSAEKAGLYDTLVLCGATGRWRPLELLSRRAAHTAAILCLGGPEAVSATAVSYGLLDGNPWLKALWGQEYPALMAEGERLLQDPFAANWWVQVERYLVAGLPAGCTSHLLLVWSSQSEEKSPGKVDSLEAWVGLLADGFLRSDALRIECFKHSQSPAVVHLMRFLDENVFLRTIGRPIFGREFGAAFLDRWAVDLVRNWYRRGGDSRLTEYKGVILGEPAEYDQLRLVLAALKAGVW